MTEAVIVAVITGGMALAGTVIASIMSSRLTTYKIEELRRDFDELGQRVDKHNNLVERVAINEQRAKAAHRRIDEIKDENWEANT